MPSYVPRNTPVRKQEILHKREIEFLHVLKQKEDIDRIHRISEKIREAQLNLLKAKMHFAQVFREEDQNPENDHRKANIKREIQRWKNIKIEEIVKIYSQHI